MSNDLRCIYIPYFDNIPRKLRVNFFFITYISNFAYLLNFQYIRVSNASKNVQYISDTSFLYMQAIELYYINII